MFRFALKVVSCGFLACTCSLSAQMPQQIPISVDANLVLDAAGPQQRESLSAIYLIVCPGVGAGTGFLHESGAVVTNSHVVATCDETTLIGLTSSNRQIRFSKIINDPGRDLALLIPKDTLSHGLRLLAKDNPPPGTEVSTWGYPLLYNGATPLLSVGYISGFRTDSSNGRSVKHIIVNGAFNHGNSGGPLLVAQTNQVIGVVVLTFHFYPPQIKQIIDRLSQEGSGLVWSGKRPDGTAFTVSEAQVTATVLKEFYDKTQVMIGEAIAGSEVRAMLHEYASDLPHKSIQPVSGQMKSTIPAPRH